MDIKITLDFLGRTEEALEFYREAIEAETLFLMRYRDRPDASRHEAEVGEKIFHATFRVGSVEIMASDCGCEDASCKPLFEGFSLALSAGSVQKAEQYFASLSAGGQVMMPLAKTFFAERYGIVIDRFGISWKVRV